MLERKSEPLEKNTDMLQLIWSNMLYRVHLTMRLIWIHKYDERNYDLFSAVKYTGNIKK